MGSKSKDCGSSAESGFQQVIDRVLDGEERFSKDNSVIKVGVETEYFLVEENHYLRDIEKRNDILESLNLCKKELGADSVEIATDAIRLNSLDQLEKEIGEKESRLVEEASKRGLHVLRSGTNPFRAVNDLELSEKASLKEINRYFRGSESKLIGEKNSVDVGDARAASLISALHTNIEASSFSDAVRKANYIYMISPYISAVSGNARFLDMKDTGLSDLRMILWEESHSGEEIQIGRMDSYYSSMADYLERVKAWPEVIEYREDILESKIAHYWKDSRIKFNGDDLIVESRIASTQPSVKEDVAVHAFCLGRVLYAIDEDEELLDIEKVNRNRGEAMRKGLDGEMYNLRGHLESTETLVLKEIDKAFTGLKSYNLDSEYLELLKERVRKGKVPSDRIAEKFQEQRDEVGDRKALFTALEIK